METLFGLGVGMLVFIAIVWLAPIVLIATSPRTTGTEKMVWILLILLFSWFSWILYVLIAPVHKPEVRP